MRYLTITVLLGVALLFTACHKEASYIWSDPTIVSFKAEVDEIDGALIKGTPTTSLLQVADIGVFAYNTGASDWETVKTTATSTFMHNIKVTPSAGGWSYTPEQQWPSGKTSFFAYSPQASLFNGIVIPAAAYTGAPTLKFTVPQDCADQPDLLVAVQQLDKSTGAVDFKLKHALSCISFKLKGNNEKITSISVKGISVSGTVLLDNSDIPKWSMLEPITNARYDAGIVGNLMAGGSMTNITQSNGYLMMIPQTLGADAKLIITVDDVEKEVSLSGKIWEPGKRYTYSLTMATVINYDEIIGLFGGWDEDNLRYTKLLEIDKVTEEDPSFYWTESYENIPLYNRESGLANLDYFLNGDPVCEIAEMKPINYCYLKNDKNGNGVIDNGEIIEWYLPSQIQLMSMWIANNSISPSSFALKPSPYWSSTAEEYNYYSANAIDFKTGAFMQESNYTEYHIRCVKDVTPIKPFSKITIEPSGYRQRILIDNSDLSKRLVSTIAKPTFTNSGNSITINPLDIEDLASEASNKTISLTFELATEDVGYNESSYPWQEESFDNCFYYSENGHSGWRLPTIRELAVILSLNKDLNNQNSSYSLNRGIYWSATEITESSGYRNTYAWAVDFNQGRIIKAEKYTSNFFRCVRDLAPIDPIIIGRFGGWDENKKEYTKRLEVTYDGGPALQFVWCAERYLETLIGTNHREYGQTNTDIVAQRDNYSDFAAIYFCASKPDSDGKGKWYLPSIDQLMAIWIAEGEFNKATQLYSDTYYTSTEQDKANIWVFDFYDGTIKLNDKKGTYFRCVRDVE